MAGLSAQQRTPTLSCLRGERKCSQLKEKFENGIWKTRYVQYRGQVWQIASMARPLSKRSQPSRDLQWHKKQKTVSQKESFTQYGRDFWKTAKYQKASRRTNLYNSSTTSLPVSRRSNDDASYRQFFWLRFFTCSTFPEDPSSGINETRSTSQRRDRAGISPASLLSFRTCNININLLS